MTHSVNTILRFIRPWYSNTPYLEINIYNQEYIYDISNKRWFWDQAPFDAEILDLVYGI